MKIMKRGFKLIKQAAKWYFNKMAENPYMPTGTVWIRDSYVNNKED